MTRVRVAVDVDAPPAVVWDVLRDIGSHVVWMVDAVAIRFTSSRREGVGTTFECDTRVGPLRLVDRMEVVRWRPRKELAIRHVGVVTGTGRILLRRRRGGRCRVVWDERLRFPWWLGGPVGGLAGARVLALIWRKDLRNLRRLVESRL